LQQKWALVFYTLSYIFSRLQETGVLQKAHDAYVRFRFGKTEEEGNEHAAEDGAAGPEEATVQAQSFVMREWIRHKDVEARREHTATWVGYGTSISSAFTRSLPGPSVGAHGQRAPTGAAGQQGQEGLAGGFLGHEAVV
jgi:hypothetical protein